MQLDIAQELDVVTLLGFLCAPGRSCDRHPYPTHDRDKFIEPDSNRRKSQEKPDEERKFFNMNDTYVGELLEVLQ